jgi:hypothetical protein
MQAAVRWGALVLLATCLLGLMGMHLRRATGPRPPLLRLAGPADGDRPEERAGPTELRSRWTSAGANEPTILQPSLSDIPRPPRGPVDASSPRADFASEGDEWPGTAHASLPDTSSHEARYADQQEPLPVDLYRPELPVVPTR